MSKVPSSFDAPADSFGYGRYSICLHAPESFAGKVQAFREEIGMADFDTEPHISVVPGPVGVLDELKRVLADLAPSIDPVPIELAPDPFYTWPDGGGLRVAPTPELLALRQSILTTLTSTFGPQSSSDRDYHPHITLYQSATDEESAKGVEFGPELDVDGFTVTSLDLVGRLGRPRAGSRDILAQYPFRSG